MRETQIAGTSRSSARAAAAVVMIWVAMVMTSVMATSWSAYAQMSGIEYGYCTYGCDAIRQRCLSSAGKEKGMAACDMEHRNCRDRCERERDKDSKPGKPILPEKLRSR
jgi:hypothetical protein